MPLLISLPDLPAEVVVVDGPIRPRWPVDVVGVECGGHRGLSRHRHQLSTPDTLTEAGIVVGGVKETIMSRAAVASLGELRATGLFLKPLIPDRAIVQEVRISGEWYGQYRKGARVLDAYTAIAKKVLR